MKNPPLSSEEKLHIIQTYAPLVLLEKEEEFFPSSIEYTFPHLERYVKNEESWLRTKQKLVYPRQILSFFHGEQNLTSVPMYAFWVEKKHKTELIYFAYYPYNQGKKIQIKLSLLGLKLFSLNLSTWGNHVGDWEKIRISINGWTKNESSWLPQITEVIYSYHGNENVVPWNEVEKYTENGNTHPVAYAAKGSHGTWPTPGKHTYFDAIVFQLHDQTNRGKEWRTWKNIRAYDYNQKEGINTSWPLWMNRDWTHTEPGLDPSDPTSGAIKRWGNEKEGCTWDRLIEPVRKVLKYVGIEIPNINQCILNEGPTGPPSKDVWEDAVEMEQNKPV